MNADRRRIAVYAAVVFISSALLLILEIVAARLIAPHVGVSLYTWSAVIGIVLAATLVKGSVIAGVSALLLRRGVGVGVLAGVSLGLCEWEQGEVSAARRRMAC